MNIVQAMSDANLFQPWFPRPDSWKAWRAFLAALFALPMSEPEERIYKACTRRSEPPGVAPSEGWLIVGRRGGKSFMLALTAVWMACFKDWRPYLAKGEVGTVMIIAADRSQARVIMGYVKGLLTVPMLAELVESDGAESITLRAGVRIEVHTASFRSTRGYTVVAALLDEVAFWHGTDAAHPDVEILNALRPAMATIPGAMLLAASSPYARRGILWDAWKAHYGKDGPVLVWQAATSIQNPSVPQRVIDEAYERDSARAQAEFGAQFRSDVQLLLDRERVEACVADIGEIDALSDVSYAGFVDPSGGSQDSFSLAIGHRSGDLIHLDCLRERRPPFSPSAVVEEYAGTLKDYGVTTVEGDRYAGEWPREAFRKHGINYRVASQTKSQIYQSSVPVINAGKCELLDNARLINQLCSLERKVSRGGRDSIDHPPGGHDDIANAACGVLASLSLKSQQPLEMMRVRY